MGEWFGQMLSIVLTALGLVSAPDAAVLGLAIALVWSVGAAAAGGAPHPWRAIDVSTLLAQSDPDAAGHPRPRAPGVVTAA